MAIQARVTSTDAIESFRAKLIVFLNKARLGVDDVGDEVRRTRSWLQTELPVRWEGEIRRRSKALQQAQSELRNAEFAGTTAATVQVRQAAVNRAKQALAEAEDKLRRIKKWSMAYDHHADPIVKRLENFRSIVMDDLPKAIAHLRNIQKALDAYTETGAPMLGSSLPGETESASTPAPGESAETAPSTGPAAP
jgi:hypothetical protein